VFVFVVYCVCCVLCLLCVVFVVYCVCCVLYLLRIVVGMCLYLCLSDVFEFFSFCAMCVCSDEEEGIPHALLLQPLHPLANE
jgi:hypothetical protein